MSRQLPRTLYWVMYNEGTRDGEPLYAGAQPTRTVQHYGTENLEAAKKDALHFRDLASQGKHFLNENQWPNLVLNSAWIEVEQRDRMEF
jgi:hypothetical protein